MFEEYAKKGIIEPAELDELLKDSFLRKDIRILDGTFALPNSEDDPAAYYQNERIGGALFFDIKRIACPKSNLPHMIDGVQFVEYITDLGITNDQLIVVYGQTGMVMGPARTWWSFRVNGHKNVVVLNGGLPAWKAEGFPVDNGEPPPAQRKTNYAAPFNIKMIQNLEQVKDSMAQNKPIWDARPPERFNGETPEPRPGMRAGHIPGSKNVPAKNLVDPETGKLKSTMELMEIIEDAGFEPHHTITLTCGSGVTACMIALAMHKLGHKNYSVYDGSWSEWGQEGIDTPVEATAK